MKISSKIIIAIFVALAISQSFVQSCNSDTGATGTCTGNGTKDTPCNDNCVCNSALLMTCIENKCSCNLKSQGGFGATCNSDCPCKTTYGLQCISGVCQCNSSVSLWDTDKCVKVNSITDCDTLVGTVVGASPFKEMPSESGWKCVTASKTIYGPSYDEKTSKGKYFFDKSLSVAAADATKTCTDIQGSRIQPSTGDALETFFKKFTTASPIWLGISKNNQNGKYYYDNGTITSITPTGSEGCVQMTPGATIAYATAACSTQNNFMCAL